MIVNKKELKQKEAILYKVKSKRAILPILNTYLIDKDTITATDLENTITFKLDTKNEDSFCIEGDRLHKFLAKIDSETVEIVASEEHITIKGDVKIKLKNDYPAKDYPTIPNINIQDTAVVGLEDIKELMKYVYKAVSKDETRPVLTGIHWNITNRNIKASSTDSYRIHTKKCKMYNDIAKDFDFMVEGRNTYNIFKSLKGSYLNIKKGKALISFSNDDFRLTTRLMDNNFPNSKMLFEDSNFNYVYKINVEDFTKTLKKLIPFMSKRDYPDHTPYLNFMGLHELSVGLHNREETISKDIKIETLKGKNLFEIGVNLKYLLEAVENLEDEYIYLKVIQELKPIWIIPQKTDFKALIMPIRIT